MPDAACPVVKPLPSPIHAWTFSGVAKRLETPATLQKIQASEGLSAHLLLGAIQVGCRQIRAQTKISPNPTGEP